MKQQSLLGIGELEKALEEFGLRAAKRILKKALKEAIPITAIAADRLVPVETGALREAQRIEPMREKKGKFGFRLKSGWENYTGETFYGAFLFYGHRQGKRSLGLRRATSEKAKKLFAMFGVKYTPKDDRKVIPPQPWLLDAFNESKEEAQARIQQVVTQGIEREAKRLAKRISTA